jgi:SAM-dependent methyltransferase
MSKSSLDKHFWNSRWANRETGWDIGYASPAIIGYLQQYPDKDAAILIPGCGNAYEAQSMLEMGFSNIVLLDISEEAISRVREKFRDTPGVSLLCGDFFEHKGQYDLIIEQTFFCALDPSLRQDYVRQSASLLKEGGRLMGLLFDRDFEAAGPPFGGHKEEYLPLFSTHFHIHTMQTCYNSIPPRAGFELFINLLKKS